MASPLVASLAWIAALMVDPEPLQAGPAFLVAFGLVTSAVVAVVGMILVGGRWAHRLGLVALGITFVTAVVRSIDVFWVVGVVLSVVALASLLSPIVSRSVRKLPAASGPPPRVVAPALLLVVTPCVLGLVGNDATDWALLTVGLSAPVAALLYSRVIPGGLIAIRLGWPALALGLAPLMGLTAGAASAAIAVVVVVLAWDSSVKASYHPPMEVGTTFPIPPELAPREVLDAAEIDERGRRK